MGQVDRLGPSRNGHPRRLPCQPQAHLQAAGQGGGCDGEPLVEPLERLRTAGDLHDKTRWGFGHGTQATITVVEAFFITLLSLTVVVVTWFAGFTVYRLIRTPR